jgi:hypothetical protein
VKLIAHVEKLGMNKMKVSKNNPKIANKKGFRCCSDKTIEILDGVIKIGKEFSTNKNDSTNPNSLGEVST